MAKKRAVSIVLALCIVLTALPLTGVLSLAATSGDFQYEVLSETDKTCEITGYMGDATEVIIPTILDGYTVTDVGERAFAGRSLASITIPDSVTGISHEAFIRCRSLTTLTIPNSVTWIGYDAFNGCTSLASVTIPDSVGMIRERAFYDCTSLASITLSDNVTTMGEGAFSNTAYYNNTNNWENDVLYIGNHCIAAKSNLSGNYAVKDGTKTIAGCAFSDCASLKKITIPAGVGSIGDSAFSNCTSLESVTIGEGLTSIGYEAFSGCTSLTNITIPNSVASVGHKAFYDCASLAEVIIPNSVWWIGENVFYGCTEGLVIYGYAGSYAETYATENGIPFALINEGLLYEILSEEDKICEITWYTGSATELEIPLELDGYTVMSIGDYAFSSCSSLINVTIPNGVTSIGDYAFSSCSSLINVTIPNGVTSIGEDAFSGCTSLKNVTISNGVLSLGDGAFMGCTALESITIPNSVTDIGKWVFSNCTALENIFVDAENPNYSSGDGVLFNKAKTELLQYPAGKTNTEYTIPSSVKHLGSSAFYNNASLKTIIIPNSVTSVDAQVFESCTALESIVIPSSVETIASGMFSGCVSLQNVTISDGITSIEDYAFGDCESLKSIQIPNSVTNIGWGAFLNCTALIDITISDNVESLGTYAFSETAYYNNPENWENGVLYIGRHCVDAQEDLSGTYAIKEGTKTISGYAFHDCTFLTEISIPDSITSIGEGAFENCASLTSIVIPDSVTFLGLWAFENCTSLKNVTLSKGMTSISALTFWGCTSLESVIIPNSIISIGENAFENCSNLTIYGFAGSDAESYAAENGILFVALRSPTKHKSQVRFTEENGDLADAFDYRLTSVISDTVWDSYFVGADGNVTITAVGFVAANESDAATLADAQAAVENGTALPAGWKTADTDYIQKTDDDADAYFGCIIKGIKHSEQTEDIVCSAYIAYTTAAGQTAYVWYDAPIVAPVATNYDAAANAWREMNA